MCKNSRGGISPHGTGMTEAIKKRLSQHISDVFMEIMVIKYCGKGVFAVRKCGYIFWGRFFFCRIGLLQMKQRVSMPGMTRTEQGHAHRFGPDRNVWSIQHNLAYSCVDQLMSVTGQASLLLSLSISTGNQLPCWSPGVVYPLLWLLCAFTFQVPAVFPCTGPSWLSSLPLTKACVSAFHISTRTSFLMHQPHNVTSRLRVLPDPTNEIYVLFTIMHC